MARLQPAPNRTWLGLSVLLLAGLWFAAAAAAQPPGRTAYLLEIDGAIGPATSDYVMNGLARTEEEGADLVILRIDTPGGLDTSMREIIREILRAPTPVVAWVHPGGARAASAGAFILYASHVAAMTPGTNVGAATPVQIGGAQPQQDEPQNGEKAPSPATAAERKAINDAVAYIRSLAELRGRDTNFAEAAVREAASLSAEAALERGVVEIVASDPAALLAALDGRTVTAAGAERTIETAGMRIVEVAPDWRTRLLGTITNPNVALILMLIGIYGLFFEFMNPGALVPGTVGAISLLLGLYALAALPVNFAGIALILLGLALMAAEAFSPSFGILGVGGIAAFVLGGAILFDTEVPQFQLDWAVIAGFAVASALVLAIAGRVALKSRRRKVVSGREELVGATGAVLDWADGKGHVFVHSERWRAVGPAELRENEPVRVTGVSGLVLEVEAAGPAEPV